jgi:saccharopine dehydrogenase-like NADP-dependent oxidoreductase
MRRIGSGAVVGQTAFNPVIAMELLATGVWKGDGVLGPECFDPDPYIKLMDEHEYFVGMIEMESPYKKKLDKEAIMEPLK